MHIKKAHSKRLKVDKDAATISKGYLNDNAIKYSLKEKTKVQIIDSVEAKWLNSKGFLAAKIEFHRRQTHIEDIFVILHFDFPQHFACLHVKESTSVYYDSLKNNTGRPFSEYPDLRNLGDIEIHAPDVWQAEVECGCMVVLRF